MRQAGGWLLATVIALLGARGLCVFVVPLLLYPPLPAAELQQVAAARSASSCSKPKIGCATISERPCCRVRLVCCLSWVSLRPGDRSR